MDRIRTIDSPNAIRACTDPRRMEILGLLMAEAHTVSSLGERLGRHPAWTRHHVKVLESVGLVELVETRVTRNYAEKFYRATAAAYTLSLLLRPVTSRQSSIVAMVSSDLAVSLLGETGDAGPGMETVVTGSLDGLIGVRQGLADIAGCHLVDADTGEYNLSFARHLFPDRDLMVVTLAHREQGLIVAPGNPLRLRDIDDVIERSATLVGRNRGSGTRIWLDRALRARKVDTETVPGYQHTVQTHTEAALEVAQGRADVAVGVSAAAHAFGLEFVPLFKERYDLVMPQEVYERDDVIRLLDRLHSKVFRKGVARMVGYDPAATGDEYRLAV
ncbi:MAG: substrate-binding domain-containing protein [Coriobacteriia bacterium]|nr:substrate-binding domain-containing protein [Coriobacteriia bacterium]